MYLLELLRKEFPTDKINTELNKTYDNLLVLISDITYENNEGKIFRDLAKIKSHISTLKESLTLIK